MAAVLFSVLFSNSQSQQREREAGTRFCPLLAKVTLTGPDCITAAREGGGVKRGHFCGHTGDLQRKEEKCMHGSQQQMIFQPLLKTKLERDQNLLPETVSLHTDGIEGDSLLHYTNSYCICAAGLGYLESRSVFIAVPKGPGLGILWAFN